MMNITKGRLKTLRVSFKKHSVKKWVMNTLKMNWLLKHDSDYRSVFLYSVFSKFFLSIFLYK